MFPTNWPRMPQLIAYVWMNWESGTACFEFPLRVQCAHPDTQSVFKTVHFRIKSGSRKL